MRAAQLSIQHVVTGAPRRCDFPALWRNSSRHDAWSRRARWATRNKVAAMAISTEGKLSLVVGLLGLAGGGAVWVAPDHTEIGWSMIAIAVIGSIALAFHHFSPKLEQLWQPSARLRMTALAGMIVFGLGFFGSAAVYFWVAPPSKADEGMALARLAELGWTVKPMTNSIQFEKADGSPPPMKDSAVFFQKLHTPFRIVLQRVTGLYGLHYLSSVPGCTEIDISAGEFTDISELHGLTYLSRLAISQLPLNGTGVVDGSALSSLTNLQELVLGSTRIKNIKFAFSMRKLRKLNIERTLVSEISPIINLTSLESVDIRDTRITDLRPLESDQRLSDLMIGGDQIPSLVNLAHLASLKKLSIIEQRSIDLSPVSSLVHLEELWIWGGSLPLDIGPLKGLVKLQKLTIIGIGFGPPMPIVHIETISGFKELRTLVLGELPVSDLSFISDLHKLTELNINRMPVQSISPLAGLRSLEKLSMIDIPVVDISPLLGLPEFRELSLIRVPARADVIKELEQRGVKVGP